MSLIRYRLFGHLLVLSALASMTMAAGFGEGLLVFGKVFGLLYGLVLISNLAAALLARVRRGTWRFSWREVQSASAVIFYASPLWAFLQVGYEEPLTFWVASAGTFLIAILIFKGYAFLERGWPLQAR